jgi:hypothetical protein
MTQDEFIAYLRGLGKGAGTQRALAAQLGLSLQQLNDTLLGTRLPAPQVLAALGFTRLILYIPREGTASIGSPPPRQTTGK